MIKNILSRASHFYLIILVFCYSISRIPFRSQVLFNWDSVNYALGIIDFNIIKHRPHPPGYILYIYLAKLINQWFVDPNLSLTIISITSGFFAVIITYIFSYKKFGCKLAFFSALLLLTNPLQWLYDEVALTYSLETFFTILLGYMLYRALNGSITFAYLGVSLLAIAGGFRQTTIIYFLPLAIYATYWLPTYHKLMITLIASILIALWTLPMISLSGGLVPYLNSTLLLSTNIYPTSFSEIVKAIFYAGNISLVIILCYWVGLIQTDTPLLSHKEKIFTFLWIAPGLFIITIFHIGQSGYVLFLLPPLFIYTPPIIKSMVENITKKISPDTANKIRDINYKLFMTFSSLLIINVVSFVLGGKSLVDYQNRNWFNLSERLAQYSPSNTIVLTNLSLDNGFRHSEFYLEDYQVYAILTSTPIGPFLLEKDKVYNLGWIFRAQNLHDNYELSEEGNLVHPILELPNNTTGLLITDKNIVTSIIDNPENYSSHLQVETTENGFYYISLPDNTNQLTFNMSGITITQ